MKIDLKKVKPRRPLNPFADSEKIFKCRHCKNHHYLPKQAYPGVCKDCASKEKTVLPLINKDFAIFCPTCRIPLMKAKKDIHKGDTMNPSDFEFLTEHKPTLGSRTVHEACGSSYVNPRSGMPYVMGLVDEKSQGPESHNPKSSDPGSISMCGVESATPIVSEDAGEVQNG